MKRKIGVISDLNNKTIWKKFINNKSVDEWIFLGNIIDIKHRDDIDSSKNLDQVLQLKIDNPNKITLLLGNNELSYLDTRFRRGYQHLAEISKFSHLLRLNKSLFKIAHSIQNYLFTHAGVCEEWLTEVTSELETCGFPKAGLSNALNKMNDKDYMQLHRIGKGNGGYYNCGGITMAHKDELFTGIIAGWHQIVGHTPVKEITTYTKIKDIRYRDRSITFTNCLDVTEECLVIKI